MNRRGNEFDVSCTIATTDPTAVNAEVDRIFRELYPQASTTAIDQAFRDTARLYRGLYPGYHACDTPYHDIQHVLDVTLAMARLIDGYERARAGSEPFEPQLFQLGVVTALFHDIGYLRTLDDSTHRNGSELTLTHVSRGAHFLRHYLPRIGLPHLADVAAALIHFTGYETPVSQINVPSLKHKLLGSLLGSADIIAQMSDRCYLEKCRDRLYPEFVEGGLARKRSPDGKEEVIFESGRDLVLKTPTFYSGATRRLENDLGGTYRYVERHFGGDNLYIEELNKNIDFANALREEGSTDGLRRHPPNTLIEEA